LFGSSHDKKPTDHFLGVALSERSGNDRSRHRDLSLSRSGTGQTQGGWVAKFMGQCCTKLQNQMIIKHDLPEGFDFLFFLIMEQPPNHHQPKGQTPGSTEKNIDKSLYESPFFRPFPSILPFQFQISDLFDVLPTNGQLQVWKIPVLVVKSIMRMTATSRHMFFGAWDSYEQFHAAIWMFPKIMVPPNHPFQ